MPSDRDEPRASPRPTEGTVSPDRDEPEPDWAEEIRARRRARSDRLREIFATFDDDPERGAPAATKREEPRP